MLALSILLPSRMSRALYVVSELPPKSITPPSPAWATLVSLGITWFKRTPRTVGPTVLSWIDVMITGTRCWPVVSLAPIPRIRSWLR